MWLCLCLHLSMSMPAVDISKSAFASFRCPLHILIYVFHIFLLSLFPGRLASFVLVVFLCFVVIVLSVAVIQFCNIRCRSMVRKMEDNIVESKEDIIDTRPTIFLKWNKFSICVVLFNCCKGERTQNDVGIHFILSNCGSVFRGIRVVHVI